MPDHLSLAVLLSIPAYVITDAAWSGNAAWAFVLANLSPIAGASAASGGIITWLRTKSWDALVGGLFGAIAGPAVVFVGYFLLSFFCYPAAHDTALQQRIAELGGAPDVPVSIPQTVLSTDKDRIVSALTSLSAFMNVEGRAACDNADQLQRNMTNVAETAQRLDDTFTRAHRIYDTLLGPENKSGMLKGGDPEILTVLAVAIPPKDYNIIVDFDGYTNQLSHGFRILNRAAQESGSGSAFISQINELLSERIQHFRDYTNKFCVLIDKTNARITELRKQVAR